MKEPVWTRPGQPALPYGHPDNLLGARWLGWYQDGVKTDYGFHGTNDESGVGGRVSSGCIRMRNADVELLFELLPSGARVVVQP
ncbi:MAG: L,D-transpeptidase [Planctomycetota bacterium]